MLILNNIMNVTLVNGDEVICNVSKHIEVIDGLEKEVCYKLTFPFTVSEINDGQQLNFLPWKKWSRDTEYLISYDMILNISAPFPNMQKEFQQAAQKYASMLESINYQQDQHDNAPNPGYSPIA
tara:strand:- start:164 stop:535 length:372 start_codon:yes stop_codon:yes gene_type:complete